MKLDIVAPTLRFKEFNIPYLSASVSELTNVYDGTHQTPKYVSSGIPFYSVEHVTRNEFTKTKFISEEVFVKECKRVRLEKGDILMSRIGDVGSIKYIDWDVRASFYVSLALFKNLGKIDSSYFAHNMSANSFQKELWSRMIHVAFPKKINLGEISNCILKYPSCIKEQQKIAEFLTSVDNKISQLTEKHRLLREYKKGVMQQIFSQRVRFKDEDGKAFPEWKTYPLKQILSLQSDSLDMQDDSTYELITVKRGFGGVVSRGLFQGKDVLVKNQFTIHENEFVISKRQIVHGACGLVPPELEGAIVSNEYNVFRPVEGVLDIDYFNRFATTPLMRRAFFINSDGVHIEKLLFKTQSWLKTKVKIPCLEEQQKIAQFLQSLDDKIDAVVEQIKHTKQFKKGLLQQMFV